jgi:glycosyltransferase involved in cell wall biosynthesis
MNILLIPATDYLHHPVVSRQHHIFENLTKTDRVHVLQFDLYLQNSRRKTSVTLHRMKQSPSKGLSSFYLLNFLVYAKKILEIVKKEHIDVVIISNLLPGIPTLLSKRLGCKVVVDLKDLFSDNAAIYYRNSFVSSIVNGCSEWVLQRLLKRADHVIAVSAFLSDYAKGVGVKNVSLITNGAELSIFKPNLRIDKSVTNIKEKLRSAHVIGFVGSIDGWVDFETVLLAMKELVSSIPDLKLLVIGGKMVTGYLDDVKSFAAKLGLDDRIISTGFVPHTEVPKYLALMDVGLIPMRQGLRLNQARCPDKLFEYLACGIPVVSTPVPEVVRIGKRAVKLYNSVPTLINALSDVFSNRTLQTQMAKDGIEIAKNYDWNIITANYRNVLQAVL